MTAITITAREVQDMAQEGKTEQGALMLAPVRAALEELEIACQRKIDAAQSFRDAVKVVAAKAGVDPSALSTYINARVQDKLAEHHKKAEQLSMLFEEIA